MLTSKGKINGTGNELKNALTGNQCANTLAGKDGADTLSGAGLDTFAFINLSDSTAKASSRDTILDFASGDHIDLSAIDASSKAKGMQSFPFLGEHDFDGKAGELRYEKQGSHILIHADVDGDRHADFALQVDDVTKLTQHDFLL